MSAVHNGECTALTQESCASEGRGVGTSVRKGWQKKDSCFPLFNVCFLPVHSLHAHNLTAWPDKP
jgi:hypothetical protein